jgi:hypothetical protein
VTHSFLLESGNWLLSGSWTEQDGRSFLIKGKTIVRWNNDAWFTQVTKLIFPEGDRPEISLQYKGHLDITGQRFTFILIHSSMGSIEGEGWLTQNSIIQRYCVLQDKQVRTGFESIYRINPKTYTLSSALLSGQRLNQTMEALLERQDG